ncbi:hypothetical protein NDU88_010470 [Pleurodeles waltl]|uniref:Uncharacterized protein n=1 Tax=Pleurodeles waltl TaxID=8319 RepID=A0AAV7PV98_PLEWA|nr:hypothetical protein NDU88_010470 [Pleurodeles waltl]
MAVLPGAWLSHPTWRARAGRALRRNRLKQRLGGGARRPVLAAWTRRARWGFLGWSRLLRSFDSRAVPRSCGPRHEAELRGRIREWGEAESAAGTACKDWTSAGPLAGDPPRNR